MNRFALSAVLAVFALVGCGEVDSSTYDPIDDPAMADCRAFMVAQEFGAYEWCPKDLDVVECERAAWDAAMGYEYACDGAEYTRCDNLSVASDGGACEFWCSTVRIDPVSVERDTIGGFTTARGEYCGPLL